MYFLLYLLAISFENIAGQANSTTRRGEAVSWDKSDLTTPYIRRRIFLKIAASSFTVTSLICQTKAFENRLSTHLGFLYRLDHGRRQRNFGVVITSGIPLVLTNIDNLNLPLLGIKGPTLAPSDDTNSEWTGPPRTH